VIAARLAKLEFIAEEKQLAFHLTVHLGDPFVARAVPAIISLASLFILPSKEALGRLPILCGQRKLRPLFGA
jgi:hypothetical protein